MASYQVTDRVIEKKADRAVVAMAISIGRTTTTTTTTTTATTTTTTAAAAAADMEIRAGMV